MSNLTNSIVISFCIGVVVFILYTTITGPHLEHFKQDKTSTTPYAIQEISKEEYQRLESLGGDTATLNIGRRKTFDYTALSLAIAVSGAFFAILYRKKQVNIRL